MNPDQPSREQIEARITALLLGELPADEASLLRYTISQDPELQRLHDELRAALPLVHEAEKIPTNAAAEAARPLRLSDEKRQQLFAHFKTQRTKGTPETKTTQEPLFWLKRIKAPSLIPTLALIAFVAILAAMLLPALSKAKMKSQRAMTLSLAKQTDEARLGYQVNPGHSLPSGPEDQVLSAPAEGQKQSSLQVFTGSAGPNASAGIVHIEPALPSAVTLNAEPQLAPPPASVPKTEIVLPQAEPASGQLAQTFNGSWALGAPEAGGIAPAKPSAPNADGDGKTHEYSQNVVGYVNVAAPTEVPAPAAPPAPVATLAQGNVPDLSAVQAADSEAVLRQSDTLVARERAARQLSGQATVPTAKASPTEEQRLPDVATVATEDRTYERMLIDVQKKRVGTEFKKNGNYEGYFALSEENSTNILSSSPDPASGQANAYGVVNGFAPSGGGGGGGGGSTLQQRAMNTASTPGNAMFAFNDGNAIPAPPPSPAPVSAPLELPPGSVMNDMANEDVSAKVPERHYASSLRDRGTGTAARFYRNPPPEQEEKKTLAFGDIPSTGNASIPTQPAPPTPTILPPPPLSTLSGEGGATVSIGGALPTSQLSGYSNHGQISGFGGTGGTGGTIRNSGGIPNPEITITAASPVVQSPIVAKINPNTGLPADASFETGATKEDNEQLRYLLTNGEPQSNRNTDNPFVARYAYVATNSVLLDNSMHNVFSPGTSATSSPAQKEETIAPGLIDFEGADLNEVLNIYAKLANRTVLRSALPQIQIELNTQAPLTKSEAIQALQAVLALNGVSLVNIGDQFVKALPSDQAGGGGEIDRPASTNTSVTGPHITRVVQLKYIKPSELIPVIQQFAGMTNSIVPLDRDGLLVLRDSAKNLDRVQEMISLVDANMPAEYISEVIPIRYAKADDITSALVALEKQRGIELMGQMKIIPNASGSSLLIYASREDLDVIKGTIVKLDTDNSDLALRKPAPNTPVPQPEILTRTNNFSTFSLNVSDVSFKFAEASLQNGRLPDTASIRSEEFINAFDYRDPEAAQGQPLAFTSERALYPFAHNRELLRFAVKTAATGRQEGRALNLVLLLDVSGSMERADRVEIIREALRVLATQLQPQDTVSVVTFSRTARLWADGVSGDKAGETLERVGEITPEGGTNLEEAMRLAYETAHRHYLANGMNRVVLLTDGAANLGNVDPGALKEKVEAQRKQGIALDCFGIGWEDFNDDLLEQLSSTGDGRYAFLNSPEDASKDFAAKLAGALEIAAADVKVQVEFNPQRVTSYRQIGYATHQLTKEQFRDNTVAAGQIAAQESGNALYTIETNPGGEGPIATVHVRYKVPGTDEYREHSWDVPYASTAPALEQSSAAMRLAATASAFSEWLAASPYAQEVTLDELLKYLSGVPEIYGADDRPKQLETMIREAKSLK